MFLVDMALDLLPMSLLAGNVIAYIAYSGYSSHLQQQFMF